MIFCPRAAAAHATDRVFLPARQCDQMKRRTIVICLSLMFIAALGWFAFVWLLAPAEWLYREKFQESKIMIEKIEEYKAKHGTYPRNAGEAGLEEKFEGPYYTLYADGEYAISFPGGECFFCSEVFDSKTGQWRVRN